MLRLRYDVSEHFRNLGALVDSRLSTRMNKFVCSESGAARVHRVDQEEGTREDSCQLCYFSINGHDGLCEARAAERVRFTLSN